MLLIGYAARNARWPYLEFCNRQSYVDFSNTHHTSMFFSDCTADLMHVFVILPRCLSISWHEMRLAKCFITGALNGEYSTSAAWFSGGERTEI